jgi:sugar (pentulose or hexulose) kinase
MMPASFVVGIDIGTSGARALMVGPRGDVVAQAFAPLPPPLALDDRREQAAALWWQATVAAIRAAMATLAADGGDPARVAAVCVDATSGTIVPVGDALQPLGPGLMYNDARAAAEAVALTASARRRAGGVTFNASYAAAKILWLRAHAPAIGKAAKVFLHQADFVNAQLLDATQATVIATDEANALKTGYDVVLRRWSPALAEAGIDPGQLPRVVPTGTTLGPIGSKAAAETGLPRGCRVVAGMTDGTAAAVASGASRVGEANTTLGTTLVWKLIAERPLVDPEGRLYCHRHPGGGFLPGGAGNAGGEGIAQQVLPGEARPGPELDRLARDLPDAPPSGLLAYPLPRAGERYPFVDAAFAGFGDPRAPDTAARYRAALEGLACIERWGFEVATALGASGDGPVWTTGMGARYPGWMQLRADFLGRPVCRAAHPASGFGSALVAAMNVWHDGDWTAAAQLITLEFRCEPRTGLRDACDAQYLAFRKACAARRPHEAIHG